MKIGMFCDLHANNIYPYNVKYQEGYDCEDQYSRIDELYSTLSFIKEQTKKNGVSFTVCGGDLFHQALRHLVGRLTVVSSRINEIHMATEMQKGFLFPGNHDQDQSSSVTAVDIFEHFSSTVLVRDKVSTRYISEVNSHFVYIPFIRNKDKVKNLFDNLYKKYKGVENVYIFCHLDIEEAYEDVDSMEKGEYNTYDELNLGTYKAVFSGHLHNRKQIRDNMFYLGASLAHNFGDAQCTRYIAIIDIKPGAFSIDYVENPFSPIFIKFDLCDTKDTVSKIKYIMEEKKRCPRKNVYARVYIENSQNGKSRIEMFLDKYENLLTFHEIKFIDSQDLQTSKESVFGKEETSEMNILDIVIREAENDMKAKEFNEEKMQRYTKRFKEGANV